MGNIQGQSSMKIGIIGYGYVGKAVASAYEQEGVLFNDPKVEGSTSINDIKSQCQTIFVCVPTPQHADGSCDSSILADVLCQLSGFEGLVISKSTALPQIYTTLESKYSDLKLAHVPEFLTAANSIADYQYPVKIIVGCRPELRIDVSQAILTDKVHYDMTSIQYCSIAEAAMVKYVANTMLAMKIIMNNEYYDICKSLGISWDNVARVASTDPRLGNTHWQVPGPDGGRGFGGACFPKDMSALLTLSRFLHTDPSMMDAAVIKNKKLRN
jgi:UDPglucose 6-dehydrogenase